MRRFPTSRRVSLASLVVVSGLANACAQDPNAAGTASRNGAYVEPVNSRQSLTCNSPSTDTLRLSQGYSYQGPAQSLDALKTSLGNVPLNLYDQWVTSSSPVRVNLRDLRVSGEQLEGRGLSSNTQSKFDVVVAVDKREVQGATWYWAKSLRVYHQAMRRHVDVPCAAPSFPEDRGQINALGAGVFLARCRDDRSPNKERTIEFHLSFRNYASPLRGNVRAQLEYNDGRQWIGTNGFAVSSDDDGISMGRNVKNEDWVGGGRSTLAYPIAFPGQFRVNYEVQGGDGAVLASGTTAVMDVSASGCSLNEPRDVDHLVPGNASTGPAPRSYSSGRSPLCPSVFPSGTTSPLLLTEETRCKSASSFQAEVDKFGALSPKATACRQAFYRQNCQ